MEPFADRRTNGGRLMEWARILAYITGTVDQELLLRNEYLAAENRILRGQLKGRLKFSDAERAKLGEIAYGSFDPPFFAPAQILKFEIGLPALAPLQSISRSTG
jgi:hypothetical protein